jgi:hypothetical protein
MTVSHIGDNIYLLDDADTKPTNVPIGAIAITRDTRRFYIRDADSWDELAYASTGASDVKTLVKETGSVIGAGLGRAVNFSVATDFTITEDAGNDEYDIRIADDAITDALIDAHTTTKITIADKNLLPATTVHTDQANTFTLSNTFEIQQKHGRIATPPADPDPDTGVSYLYEFDSDNDVFASKSKIGGVMVEVRDF